MRVIGPPPSVPGLADAIALLTAMEAAEKQKDLLHELQDYLKRAEDAKADFDAAREIAEGVIKEANASSAEATSKLTAATEHEKQIDQYADDLNKDRQAFQAERNKTMAELTDWETRLGTIETALKAREERLAQAEQLCIDRKTNADALIAEYTAKLENLKKIAA